MSHLPLANRGLAEVHEDLRHLEIALEYFAAQFNARHPDLPPIQLSRWDQMPIHSHSGLWVRDHVCMRCEPYDSRSWSKKMHEECHKLRKQYRDYVEYLVETRGWRFEDAVQHAITRQKYVAAQPSDDSRRLNARRARRVEPTPMGLVGAGANLDAATTANIAIQRGGPALNAEQVASLVVSPQASVNAMLLTLPQNVLDLLAGIADPNAAINPLPHQQNTDEDAQASIAPAEGSANMIVTGAHTGTQSSNENEAASDDEMF